MTVGGDRFANVDSSVADATEHDFAVKLDIAAGASEGPLEYRAYAVGQPPPQGWVASQVQGDAQHAVFQSPRLPKGPPSTFYDLMIESRNPADGSIQQYPFRFRVGLTIEKSTETMPPAAPAAVPAAPAANPEPPPATPEAQRHRPQGPPMTHPLGQNCPRRKDHELLDVGKVLRRCGGLVRGGANMTVSAPKGHNISAQVHRMSERTPSHDDVPRGVAGAVSTARNRVR